MMRTARLVSAALFFFAATLAHAAPSATLRIVVGDLLEPVALTHSGDGTGRMFIAERAGRIRIARSATVSATPFLDITARVGTSGERGLLGLAFHPQYAQNRRFFVYYTRRSDGAIQISSFVASASNGDLADAASEQVLVTIPHATFDNHNGGQLAFGPDGFLYAGTGDGGGSGDPSNNAQNPSSLLGKLLRIDVNAASPTAQVWAMGLRNPWRFSFDRATGDLFLGDVGQDRFEEVNYAPAGTPAGRNYGWPSLEGNACFKPMTGCVTEGMTPPVLTYDHDSGQSITGGYVYRGMRSRALYGYYIYGDYASGRIWAARQEPGGGWSSVQIVAPGSGLNGLTAFAEDESGELFALSFLNGGIFAIDGATTPNTDPGVVSGLWWNPAESGWGAQVTQRGNTIFATIYNYGPDGQPKWYIASNCGRTDPTLSASLRCSGALYETSGPRFFGVPFDPAALRVTEVGVLNLAFTDSEHGSISFNIGGQARVLGIQRQQIGSRTIAPAIDYTDLYYNPNESGWGLAVTHQGANMFVTWYVYDSAGRPEWYVASNCAVQGSGCSGTVYRVTGPPFGPTFDPTRVQVSAVGTLSLAFGGGFGDAVLTYTVNGISGSKSIVREQF